MVRAGGGPEFAAVAGRWEWRTFGERAAARLGGLEPDRVEEGDDLYLLSPACDASVKIRGGLVEVKRRLKVNEEGLEQWAPVVKAAFPLVAAEAEAVLSALAIPVRSPTGVGYTGDRLVDELRRHRGVRIVRVHKRRARYTVDGCAAEVVDLDAEGRTARSVAFESDDPDRLSATIRAFGFVSPPNLSYPCGLRELLGYRAPRCAVIDVGTNSLKFHIGEPLPDGTWRTVRDRAEVTRLGVGLADTGRFAPESIERTVTAIAGMADEAERLGVGAIAAVGTAGMRAARNAGDVVAAVRARCGVSIEVIRGEDEARLAYLAAVSGLVIPAGSLVVFDTGGGSSQFTFGRGGDVEDRFSVDVGAARYTEAYRLDGPVSSAAVREACGAVGADLARLDGRAVPDTLVGMGGAVTNLTAVMRGLAVYDPESVHGQALGADEVDRQIELYRTRTAAQRRELVGLQPDRAEVILAGACIVRTVMAKLGRDSLIVSDRGLRHGVMAERFGERHPVR